MGVIVFKFKEDAMVYAQGGYHKMLAFFRSAVDMLYMLASMLGATLHFIHIADEVTWNSYQSLGDSFFNNLEYIPRQIAQDAIT